MLNLKNEYGVAKAWATKHVVAAFAIGVALGFFVKLIL